MADTVRTLRREERLDVVIPARCRSRSGFVDRVVITDLSANGCRIESMALTVRKGDLVVVSPGVIEGQCGRVIWVKGHSAGIAFSAPLYGPVVEHLHRLHGEFIARTPYQAAETRIAA